MARVAAMGIGVAVLSSATFATSGPFGDALMTSGWSPAAAVTVRVGIAALVLTPFALRSLRGRWPLLWADLPAVIAYGLVAVAGCQLFFFNAVRHLSVGVALLLEYSGTLLVVGWMWLRHGQRPSRLTSLGGVLALGGLVLVLDLTGAQRVSGVGMLWGLAAAVGLAVYFVLSSRTEDSLPPIVMAWAGMVVGAAALVVAGLARVVPFHAATADVDFAGHQTSWVVPVLGLSVIAAAIAYTLGIAAARQLGARLATFFGLAEVLFAIIWAWLLLDQRPNATQLLGAAIVVVGIVLVRAGERSRPAPSADIDAPPAPTIVGTANL